MVDRASAPGWFGSMFGGGAGGGAGGPGDAGAAGPRSGVVKRVVVASYQANDPCEDRSVVVDEEGQPMLAAVLDGHGGFQVAEFVHDRLAREVQAALAQPLAGGVQEALARAFVALDRAWMHAVEGAYRVGIGSVATIGACCLCVLVSEDDIVCANAGDCRAVLGRSTSSVFGVTSGLEAVPLSRDLNAREPLEQEALFKAHPGEPDVVESQRSGVWYVKGRLQPTRAFGDLYLKSADFNGPPHTRKDGNHNGARGVHIAQPYSPPYITAEPEVRTFLRSKNDSFIVIASDGLWDYIENQEVVQLVAQQAMQGEAGKSRAAQTLIDESLRRAAADVRMTLDDLQQLPPGRQRRRLHDDVTVVVVFL